MLFVSGGKKVSGRFCNLISSEKAVYSFYAEFACRLSEAYGAGAEGDMKKARKIYLKLIDDISSKELEIDDSFDLFLFDKYTRAKFDLEPVEYFI